MLCFEVPHSKILLLYTLTVLGCLNKQLIELNTKFRGSYDPEGEQPRW